MKKVAPKSGMAQWSTTKHVLVWGGAALAGMSAVIGATSLGLLSPVAIAGMAIGGVLALIGLLLNNKKSMEAQPKPVNSETKPPEVTEPEPLQKPNPIEEPKEQPLITSTNQYPEGIQPLRYPFRFTEKINELIQKQEKFAQVLKASNYEDSSYQLLGNAQELLLGNKKHLIETLAIKEIYLEPYEEHIKTSDTVNRSDKAIMYCIFLELTNGQIFIQRTRGFDEAAAFINRVFTKTPSK